VSGNRPISNQWLADHVIFAGYRWLTWGVTALWLLGQGQLALYGTPLIGTLLLTLILTAFARQYIQISRHTPAATGLDILLVIAVIVSSGGWESPFIFYAYGSLVLPALLFGWPGGVMAGLTFVAINQASLTAVGMPAADRMFEGTLSGLTVTISMVVPPTFGWLFPTMVERLRHQASATGHGRRQSNERDDRESFGQEPRLDTPRFSRSAPDERRNEPMTPELPLAVQLTRTRIVEPSVEDLRRVIFAPLPAADMDLGAIFDVLVTRFSQQTSINTRVALIGRTRFLRASHRDLLVRMVQESLLNIQQHAHAGSVSLTLRYDINSIVILVQDDGSGLADGTYERPGLHALRAMRYRIAEFGGRLDIFETEGGGVTVRTTMPLE
jgi:hypothetical protein